MDEEELTNHFCDGCLIFSTLEAKVSEMYNFQIETKELLRKARTDIMRLTRIAQINLTGQDICTGDDSIDPLVIHQKGIDESLLLCDTITVLLSNFPTLPEYEM